MTLQCQFDNIELGDFTEDSYKLCFWWPSWQRRSIIQGIPGGAIQPDLPEMGFYPVNWVDLKSSRAEGAIAIANWGTLKTFRRQSRIGMVLAWGTNSNEFGNRTNAYWWSKKIDLRLKGTHMFRFAIYPHDGDWRQANVPDWGMQMLRPPVAETFHQFPKSLILDKPLLSLENTSIVPTAVFLAPEGLAVRFYESQGTQPDLRINFLGQRIPFKLFDPDGHPLKELKPWIIAEALIRT